MGGDKATEEGGHGTRGESVGDGIAANHGVERVDRGGGRGTEVAEVAEAADKGPHWAEGGVTTEAMADLLTADGVLLCGECMTNVGRSRSASEQTQRSKRRRPTKSSTSARRKG